MTTQNSNLQTAPLSDAVITAVCRLVADAQSGTREPSHSDVTFRIEKCGLSAADPAAQGPPVGKAKRVRGVLYWAMENNFVAGESFVATLVNLVRGCGGFRAESPNFAGNDAINDAKDVFATEGYLLTDNGELIPSTLDTLSGKELTSALSSYAQRARRGSSDSALVVGTGKDLLEATAAHVLQEKWGTYPTTVNFPMLLGQAFTALGFATTETEPIPGEPNIRDVDRKMYEMGCAVNRLRNKEGTGHGRPRLTNVTGDQGKWAVEMMGVIAGRLLEALNSSRN